jgi:ketosteroid isomerase-like protein
LNASKSFREASMKLWRIIAMGTFIFIAVALTACQTHPDSDNLRSEILNFHKKFIDDHLNKNIDSFVEDYAEDYIFVTHGEISHRAKDEFKASFSDYLNNTTFSEYRDLEEPIIGFSKDGSMAWSIVKVKVAGTRNLEDGSQKDFDVTYAWITLYERQGDKWIRTVEVSTNN